MHRSALRRRSRSSGCTSIAPQVIAEQRNGEGEAAALRPVEKTLGFEVSNQWLHPSVGQVHALPHRLQGGDLAPGRDRRKNAPLQSGSARQAGVEEGTVESPKDRRPVALEVRISDGRRRGARLPEQGSEELNVKWITPCVAPNRLDHARVDAAAGGLDRACEGEDVLRWAKGVEQLRLEHALRVALGAGKVVGQCGQPADDQHHRQPQPLCPGYAREEDAEWKLVAAWRVAEDLGLVVTEQDSWMVGRRSPFAGELESLKQPILEHGRLARRECWWLDGQRDSFERYSQAAEAAGCTTCGGTRSLSESEAPGRMLDGTSAVLNQREREGGFSLEVLAALTADHDPTARLRCRRVVLQQHGLADTAQAGQPDIAGEGRESCEVLVESV